MKGRNIINKESEKKTGNLIKKDCSQNVNISYKQKITMKQSTKTKIENLFIIVVIIISILWSMHGDYELMMMNAF